MKENKYKVGDLITFSPRNREGLVSGWEKNIGRVYKVVKIRDNQSYLLECNGVAGSQTIDTVFMDINDSYLSTEDEILREQLRRLGT